MVRLLALLAILATLCACAHGLAPPCGEIAQMITPCIAYLADRAWMPYGPCCNGIAALNRTAPTQEDRVAVCDCLRSIAPRLPMIDLTRAAILPRTCGADFNATVDCNSLPPP